MKRDGPAVMLPTGTGLHFPALAYFCYVHCSSPRRAHMSIPPQPNIRILNSPEYRDGYANSVQVRVSVWDFLLIFGRLHPQTTEEVEVHNFQGVYLSPQQ